MTVKQLKEKLDQLPDDKFVLCQVVAQEDPFAWNMQFKFHEIENSDIVQLSVEHPELKKLPQWK